MKPSDPIKIVSQLLDLPITDSDGRWCGVVDDVELSGEVGKEMRLAALLVGPGAYAARLPRWMFWIVRKIAGDRVTRVPVSEVESIRSAVHLKVRAESVGLNKTEDAARRWVPHVGAM
jgi:sporulation protein YlmC with PRC-barrel domain